MLWIFNIIYTSIDALEDMINEESENKAKDTFHSIAKVGQDLCLLQKA